MIYLDNAATTFPKPANVPSAVYRFIKDKGANPGRSGHRLSMAAAAEIYRCREVACTMFNASGPENIAFLPNATYAINLALKGAVSGGHIVTSNLEHNAVMRPLAALGRSGVTFDTASVDLCDDDITVSAFEHAIRPETVMIACTHASNVCGRVLPILRIGELCQKRGISFLVDASQTAGLLPVDMEQMHINYLCLPGHKGLYGPMGTGMLITDRGESLSTLIEGGTGSNSASMDQPDYMPDRMESGTLNAPGIAGLRAGMGFVAARGMKHLFEKEIYLAQMLFDGLTDIHGVMLYTPRPGVGYVPVVCFNIEGISSVEIVSSLDKLGFALRGGLHCAPAAHAFFGTLNQGMVRASIGAFNSIQDIHKLLLAVKGIAQKNYHNIINAISLND